MSRRPTSALLLAALVLQLVGPAVPLSLARLAPSDTEGQAPLTFKTSKRLPSVEERLGQRTTSAREDQYIAPDPADEPSPLAEDGTYTLGRNTDVNPDAPGRITASTDPYRSEHHSARATEKVSRDVPVTLLRTDVSGQITTNTTWTLTESPYVVTGAMTVVSPAVLTIEPGVVVKLDGGASLVALEGATILAAGTAQSAIVVTSLKDDAVAGDTNEDGDATSPAPGDWATFGSEGRNTGQTVIAAYGTYQHIQIRNGSTFTGRFSLLTLTDALIENMSQYGLYLEKNPATTRSFERLTMRKNTTHVNMYGVPSAITIKDSILTQSSYWAVLASSATAVRLTNNRIDLNDSGTRYAINASSSPMVLRYNSIAWNGNPDTGFVYGLSSTGSTVDAQYNWWGSTTGPEVVGVSATGGGSRITSLVTFTNWLGKAYEAEHKKGNLPWSAKAGVGVDVATGNLVLTETDIAIPTVGFPLTVSRTYNSLTASTVTGVFGNGWTWNYGVNLDVTTDTYGVILTSADGAKHYFKRNPDGTFTGEYGLFSFLSYDSTTQEYTLLHPNQDREIFDSAGRLARQVDPDGNTTTLTRDGSGILTTVTEPTGRTLTFTYASGRIATITDPLGRVYRYTNGGVLTKLEKEFPATTVFATCTYTYGANSVLTKRVGCDGDTLEQTFNATTKKVETQTLNGVQVRLTTVTYQDDSTVTFLYDGVGNRTRMVDTDGQLDITYDDLNRPLTRTRTSPAGTETVTYAYDEVGNLETLGYPGGFSVTYAYDDARRVTAVTDSQNRVTEYDYNTNGRILTVALPNGTNATYAYDDAGRITSVTHALGQTPFATVGHTYDDRGNRLTRTVDGTTESYTYDALARITEAAYPGNRTVGYVYDATGNRTQKTDPLGATAYTYDTADQLLNAGDGLRTYDLDGQLTQIGASRGFTWNDRGQLTGTAAVTTNAAPTARSGADASGYVDWLMFLDGSTSTDPEGIALSYTWTEVAGNPSTGVLRGVHASKPALLANVAGTYQFDLVVSDGAQISTPDRVQVTIATGLPPATVQTVVPASGLSGYVVSNLPNGRYFTSDTLITGRSSTVTFHGAAQFALPTPPPQTTLTGATLTLWGKQVASNTVTDQWSVQLLPTDMDPTFAQATYTTIAGATPDRTLTPVLVGLGQVVANQADAWTFTEDDLAVLQARLDGSGKLSLRTRGDSLGTYSRVFWYSGNTTVANRKPVLSLSYTQDPLPDQAPAADAGRQQSLDAPGTVTLDGRGSFDAEGPVTLLWTAHAANPASVTFTDATIAEPSVTLTVPGTYRFDLAVTDGADVTTTASTFVVVRSAPLPTASSFTYDGDGDRIAMTVGAVTTRFVVDPLPQNARVLAERTGETWTYHVYGHDLLYSVTGTALTVLHGDPLGSTIATTDSTGAVTARMRYDVFGERLDSDAATTAYTFAGERMDGTELQYLRARYYDPTVGRFISRDPFPAQAADTQTFNRYIYVKNNPTNYVDPSGEYVETVLDGLFVGADMIEYWGCSTVAGADCSRHLEDFAADSAAAAVPFVPAGTTRVIRAGAKGVKALDRAGTVRNVVNHTPSAFFKQLKRHRNGIRTNGLPGGKRQYMKWDPSHGGEIEIYNSRGQHIGVQNGTGQWIKGPVPGRNITSDLK